MSWRLYAAQSIDSSDSCDRRVPTGVLGNVSALAVEVTGRNSLESRQPLGN